MIDSCPIIHTSWPQFWSGQVASNRESMLVASESNGGYGAFNLGQLIGLTGLASLLPLLLMWIVAGAIWWRLHSKSENKPM